MSLSNARLAKFLDRFATIIRKLERLAQKELAGQPFDAEEKAFLKNAIKLESTSHGCGGPPSHVYSGWYPELIYGSPDAWLPTVADVHTDPNSGKVLEVGVGNVDLLVAAIDNGEDRAAYVGPVYTYYEFPSAERLTDEAWRAKIQSGKLPARPKWIRALAP